MWETQGALEVQCSADIGAARAQAEIQGQYEQFRKLRIIHKHYKKKSKLSDIIFFLLQSVKEARLHHFSQNHIKT